MHEGYAFFGGVKRRRSVKLPVICYRFRLRVHDWDLLVGHWVSGRGLRLGRPFHDDDLFFSRLGFDASPLAGSTEHTSAYQPDNERDDHFYAHCAPHFIGYRTPPGYT
jgi:hypothetical protein